MGLLALALRYLPHEYLTVAGLSCEVDSACATTLPIWANAAFSFLVGGVVLGMVLFAAFAFAGQVNCSGRKCTEVLRAGRVLGVSLPPRLRGRTLVLDDTRPLSYTIGFLRPRVVVSTGLFASLERDEVEAVLAHEEAHVAGRDNLILVLAQTVSMTFVLVPGVRLAFARLRRAQELAADEFASVRTGDSLLVASSLQKFARSLFVPAARSAPAVGFAEEGNVVERIEGLLLGPAVRTSRRWAVAALLALALVFFAFAGTALASTGVSLGSETGCGSCHPGEPAAAAVSVSAHASCCEGH